MFLCNSCSHLNTHSYTAIDQCCSFDHFHPNLSTVIRNTSPEDLGMFSNNFQLGSQKLTFWFLELINLNKINDHISTRLDISEQWGFRTEPWLLKHYYNPWRQSWPLFVSK